MFFPSFIPYNLPQSSSPSFFLSSKLFLYISFSALKLQHQRQMKDSRDEYDIEKTRIDHREVANAHEIDTLRRKCICLTKL